MLYALSRWWKEQRAIARMMSAFRPRTGRIILLMVACALLVFLLLIVWSRLTS